MEKLNSFWLCKQNDCGILVEIQRYFSTQCRGCVLCAIDKQFNRKDHCKLPSEEFVCEECIREWMKTERK